MGRLLELMWNRSWNPQLHDVPWPGRVFVLLSQLAVWALCSLFTETIIMMYRRGRGQKIVRTDDDTPLRLELYEHFADYLSVSPQGSGHGTGGPAGRQGARSGPPLTGGRP